MAGIQRILCPTDFSPGAGRALTYAILFAELHGAELHLLHAITQRGERHGGETAHLPEPEEILDHLDAVARSEMADLSRPHRGGALEVREVTERGLYPGPVIVRYAEEQRIDLIVMGTRGRRGAQRLLLGSVAEEVVRLAPCPVLTLRGPDGGPEDAEGDAEDDAEDEAVVTPEAIETVLVPIDFSAPSRRALAAARRLAAGLDARLALLHVIETRIYPTHYGHLGSAIAERLGELEQRSRDELAAVYAAAGGPEVPYTTAVRNGRPSIEIARFAEEAGSDLLVQSTHGLTGLERLVLGSTAEAVVRLAPCPVLTLRGFGRPLFED